jgi:hypothetical protein
MSWTKVSAVLPGVLLACARVTALDDADAGPPQPAVAAVDPQPGAVPGDAQFTVRFSVPIDEGQLLAASGRSETVVLAAAADVERAAAAIEHSQLSTHERDLLVPAQPQIADDRSAITLVPDQPLAAGGYTLLVSSRLKDDLGRKFAATARFAFQVAAAPLRPRLVSPAAGMDAPANLGVVRAFATSGHISLHGPDGAEVASADAHGDVLLQLSAPLSAGAKYTLALDGAEDPAQSFTAAACARNAAPALSGGAAALSARDTSVAVGLALDWPAKVSVLVGDAADGEPCTGECSTAAAYVSCGVSACGPQSFACKLDLHIDGLAAAHDYALRIVAQDDLGHESRGPLQKFTTVAPLPRLVISELMAAPPAPQGEAEYVEILNQGPGTAGLDGLAFAEADGTARSLLATAPPVPLQLAPGARALAVGSSFDPARYPGLPAGTPVLRASTQRLLARGLSDDAPPPVRLMLGAVELSDFPGGPRCPAGASLQRDETVPPDGAAAWTCGAVGGSPGTPP